MAHTHYQFNTILVPVDFSVNTKVAIDRALRLCEGTSCAIHLFFIKTKFQNRKLYNLGPTGLERLEELKNEILEKRPEIEVFTWISHENNIEKAIVRKARQLKASLIIIGKHSQHSWFPFLNSVAPSRLSEKTNIPVWTAKPGALDTDTKTVVVPVGKEIDSTKLQIMEALSRKSRIHIHLLAFLDSNNSSVGNQAGNFLSTFDWVKRNLNCPMKYGFIYGENKARALLKYCRSVNADLLLVSPVTETRIGWLNTHISDVLPAESKTQVLSVQSFNF